jgi:GNAT superfamily N-acetyltransferase
VVHPDGVGYANWVAPGRPDVEIDDSDSAEVPLWRLERYGAIDAAFTANTPPEPHWYLAMIATHPDWQRRGVGAALMEVVFAEADQAGLGCYLETETEANVAYYRLHGFEVRTEWDLTVAGSDPMSAAPTCGACGAARADSAVLVASTHLALDVASGVARRDGLALVAFGAALADTEFDLDPAVAEVHRQRHTDTRSRSIRSASRLISARCSNNLRERSGSWAP